jgi:hypothetical protein
MTSNLTSTMIATGKDPAFALALAILLLLSLAAFFCDPHWHPKGRPRITWSSGPAAADAPAAAPMPWHR